MSKTPAGIGTFAENGFLGEDVSFLKILFQGKTSPSPAAVQLAEQLNPTCFLLLEGSTGLVVVVGDASLREFCGLDAQRGGISK